MSSNPYDEIMHWPDDLRPDDTTQRILAELRKEAEDSSREAKAAARRANWSLAVAIASLLTTAVIGVLQLLR